MASIAVLNLSNIAVNEITDIWPAHPALSINNIMHQCILFQSLEFVYWNVFIYKKV